MKSTGTEGDGATKRTTDEPSPVVNSLILRGQMMLVGEWDLIIFLCTPVYERLELILNIKFSIYAANVRKMINKSVQIIQYNENVSM